MLTMDHHVVRRLANINVQHQCLLFVLLVLSAVYSVIALVNYVNNVDERRFWKSHPWAGLRKRLFPRTRAGLEAIRHTREIVERGFKEVR
jgi:hypothetical protein